MKTYRLSTLRPDGSTAVILVAMTLDGVARWLKDSSSDCGDGMISVGLGTSNVRSWAISRYGLEGFLRYCKEEGTDNRFTMGYMDRKRTFTLSERFMRPKH